MNAAPTPQDLRTLLVRFERVYGNIVCYPANDRALLITELTGKKTLGPADLKTARKLGFEVVLSLGSHSVLEEFLS